jgi:hypothetical protein
VLDWLSYPARAKSTSRCSGAPQQLHRPILQRSWRCWLVLSRPMGPCGESDSTGSLESTLIVIASANVVALILVEGTAEAMDWTWAEARRLHGLNSRLVGTNLPTMNRTSSGTRSDTRPVDEPTNCVASVGRQDRRDDIPWLRGFSQLEIGSRRRARPRTQLRAPPQAKGPWPEDVGTRLGRH